MKCQLFPGLPTAIDPLMRNLSESAFTAEKKPTSIFLMNPYVSRATRKNGRFRPKHWKNAPLLNNSSAKISLQLSRDTSTRI